MDLVRAVCVMCLENAHGKNITLRGIPKVIPPRRFKSADVNRLLLVVGGVVISDIYNNSHTNHRQKKNTCWCV